jgi:hypothetical protein
MRSVRSSLLLTLSLLKIVLWMNTVGPYSNRQETYTYFSLPFCRGNKESIEHYHETLGEALLGVELDFSGLDIQFMSESLYGSILYMRVCRECGEDHLLS